jgi:hypothetical protein
VARLKYFVPPAAGLGSCGRFSSISIDNELVGSEPMVTFFETPRGRLLIKKLSREVRESG